MCLGVPGRIISIDGLVASVDFWGVRREVRLDVVDESVEPGDYVLNHVGFAILSFSSYGIGAWHPAFLERTYGWEMGRIGLLTGGHCIVLGSLGILAGGWLTDRLTASGHTDATMRVGLLASLNMPPPSATA